jgi:hypothetical protein
MIHISSPMYIWLRRIPDMYRPRLLACVRACWLVHTIQRAAGLSGRVAQAWLRRLGGLFQNGASVWSKSSS